MPSNFDYEPQEGLLNTDPSFNRFNDAFVKYLLATEKHKLFLLDLINAVFDDKRPACIKGKVVDLTFEDRELSADHVLEKHGRLDIRAKTDTGEIIDIEVQTYAEQDIGARELFYFAKLYSSQQAKGKPYTFLKPVIIINLMAFNQFKDRKQYHSCYELREEKLGDLLTDRLSIHFIEAQKCDDLSIKNKNRLIRWMNYLTYSSPDEIINFASKDEIFTRVLEAEKMFVRDTEEMKKYNARESYEMELATREENGLAKGRAEGEAKMLEAAKKMLDAGINVAQVKIFTNLSDKQLAGLH